MTTTANYGWAYPTVGADADTWGATLNTTVIAIDAQVKANDTAAFYKDGSRAMTGKLTALTPTTSAASLNLPHGVAPTAPSNGDVWTTTAGAFVRLNGATKTLAFTDSNITGNAATATTAAQLTTGHTIGMTGDVTWTSGSFNGTGDVTGTATLANSGVTAGSYGSASLIPVVTVDAKGRVTSVSTASVPTELPTQTSKGGRVLSTDGSSAAWSGYPVAGMAYVTQSGTTMTVGWSAGVFSGITRLSQGIYTVTRTSAVADASYWGVIVMPFGNSNQITVQEDIGNRTTTTARLMERDNGGSAWDGAGFFILILDKPAS